MLLKFPYKKSIIMGHKSVPAGQGIANPDLVSKRQVLLPGHATVWKEEMSYKWMTAILPLKLPHNEKSVLTIIAFHADDEGLCWPSVSLLGKECCLSRREVQKCLAWLETNQFIKKDYRLGRSTYYQISEPAHMVRTHLRPMDTQNDLLNAGESECVLSASHKWHPGCTILSPPYWVGVSKKKSRKHNSIQG